MAVGSPKFLDVRVVARQTVNTHRLNSLLFNSLHTLGNNPRDPITGRHVVVFEFATEEQGV